MTTAGVDPLARRRPWPGVLALTCAALLLLLVLGPGRAVAEDECVENPVPGGQLCADEIVVTGTAPTDPPRSASIELTPGVIGLSPGAGSDANKKADIVLDRIEKKLEGEGKRCASNGPAAGKTYQEVLERLHALTDKIRAGKEALAAWYGRLTQMQRDTAALEQRAWTLRQKLAAASRATNPKVGDESDVLTTLERESLRRDLEATETQRKRIEATLGFEVPQYNAAADQVDGWSDERDELRDDAEGRTVVDGRLCGPQR